METNPEIKFTKELEEIEQNRVSLGAMIEGAQTFFSLIKEIFLTDDHPLYLQVRRVVFGQRVTMDFIRSIIDTALQEFQKTRPVSRHAFLEMKEFCLSRIYTIDQSRVFITDFLQVYEPNIGNVMTRLLTLISELLTEFSSLKLQTMGRLHEREDILRRELQRVAQQKIADDEARSAIHRAQVRIDRVISGFEKKAKDLDGFSTLETRAAMRAAGLDVWEPSRVVERILELAGYGSDRIRIRSHNRTWVVLGSDGIPVRSGKWGDVLHSADFKKAYAKYRLERRNSSDLEED